MQHTEIIEVCNLVTATHRKRRFAMMQRMRSDLSLGSYLRRVLGWQPNTDTKAPTYKEQEAINKAAMVLSAQLIDTGESVILNRKIVAGESRARLREVEIDPTYAENALLIESSLYARDPFNTLEAKLNVTMRDLVRRLPIWEDFAAHVPGLAEGGVGVIIGSAGALSNYSNHSKLWKRMGLAVIGAGDGLDDHRQGSPGTGATAEDWIAEGYDKKRRSLSYIIGEGLIKIAGPYREVYLARKDYEIEQAQAVGLTIAPSASIPVKRKDEFRSQGHIHRRAQRYMEKRLLRDMWQRWRIGDAGPGEMMEIAPPEVVEPAVKKRERKASTLAAA